MIFNINYNPYSNKIHFLEEGEEIRDGSSFLKYQKNKIIFQNCVEEILQLINKYENITPDGVDIEFEGTDEDYQILIDALDIFGREQGYQGIRTIHKRRLISSSDAIKKIRDCYDQIEKEFEPYIVDEQTNHNNVLGKKVIKFTETVKPEIPVCVIGNYSVGKSAFINALIGREILPSKLKACTAKNVIVRNDTSYSISITRVIDGEECRYTFRIDRNGKIFVSAIGSVSKNDALIETLSKELDIYDNPDVIVYNILDRINSFGKDSVTDVNDIVEIKVPFRNSLLDHEKYQFAFIDTPGSNNAEVDQEMHLVNLESILKEQTNALSIFMAEKSCLSGNDNSDLKKLLDRFEKGFSIQNQIIVIAKADKLVKSELEEDAPSIIKQWNATPTIMYVCQGIAIGEKRDSSKEWIQPSNKDHYTKNKINEVIDLKVPNYNKTPCRRSMPKEISEELSDALLASGIPQVEWEIQYFAKRFADYKKSTNGRSILLDVLVEAEKELNREKEQLKTYQEHQRKEQKDKKNEIIQAIEAVKCEFVTSVTRSVKSKYEHALESFLPYAIIQAESYWSKIMNDKESKERLQEFMKKLGQTNLYSKNSKAIDDDVREQFETNLVSYCESVQNCIMEYKQSLSPDTIKQLEKVFERNEKPLELQVVEPTGFRGVPVKVGMFIKHIFKREEVVEIYLKYYSKELKGDEKHLGLFYKDYIQTPAIAYSKQVKKWRDEYISKTIGNTLNQPGSILSKYDERIRECGERIRDLQNRLDHLKKVKEILTNLLDLEEV